MATVTIRYLRERRTKDGRLKGYYFVPTPAMKRAGFHAEALGKEFGPAAKRVEAYNREWDQIRKGETGEQVAPDTVKWVIREYQKSSWYTALADRTKEEVDRHLAELAASPVGRKPIQAVRRSHIRVFYDKLYAGRSHAVANDCLRWTRRVFSYAVEREMIATNPAAKMEIRAIPRRQVRWTPKEVEAFVTQALREGYDGWAVAVRIGYDTGHDLSVILGVTWSQYDGEGLDLTRSKTGVESWVPLTPPTRTLLAAQTRTAVQIVTGISGRPVTRSYFGRIYRDIRTKAGIRSELRFRDLRRTVGTEVYEAGGNIEPIIGLTPGSPVKKHYMVPTKDAARTAQNARTQREQSGRKVETPEKKS